MVSGTRPIARSDATCGAASAARSHQRSPPVRTYRNGTSGMRPKMAHASFQPRARSGRVARSSYIKTTARGWRKQTRSSRSFFIALNLPRPMRALLAAPVGLGWAETVPDAVRVCRRCRNRSVSASRTIACRHTSRTTGRPGRSGAHQHLDLAALGTSSWRLDRVYFLAFLNPSRGQPDPALAVRLASPASVGEPVTELD